MSEPSRIRALLDSLGAEVGAARPGSDQGQFPILDLLGNLRDEAGKDPAWQELHKASAPAWERVVQIVESGRPFQAEEIEWLRSLLPQLATLTRTAPNLPRPSDSPPQSASASQTVPEATAAPRPQIPAFPAPSQPGSDEDGPVELNLEADGELLREFINESREHLDNIEQGVLVLEQRPENAQTLNTVFRAFHTFKGSAGFLNLVPINRLAHLLESLLDLARQGKLKINPAVIDLILRGRDVLRSFVEQIESQVNGSKPAAPIRIATAALKADVRAMLNLAVSGAAATPAHASSAPVASSAAREDTGARGPAPAAPVAPATRSEQAAVVKVDTAKLDALLDMVGEMVIAQSLVAQDLGSIAGLNPRFARNMAQLSRITRELQRVGMSMRMVPIRGAFHKMARVVRDLGAKQHKQVQLVTSGEDTELDRGVVEELNDPLLHMIRNAGDHGVEAPAARAAAGKPAMATIHLRAYHQGGSIVLEVEDDGAGLDRKRILAKAVERGLVAPSAELSDEEVFSLIFAPGFSTAEKITDISGRGVGLDVVRSNIERLHGRVDIASTPGRGTLFKITLPLTLAIIDGLVVKVGGERYIIPTLSVRESFRPRPDMITRVQGAGEVVNVRGRLLPLLRLREYFGHAPAVAAPAEGIVVVVQSGTSCRCLLVDELLHKQEVVIKNLNELMIQKNRALAGAAIMGDGRVALILDVSSLIHLQPPALSRAA